MRVAMIIPNTAIGHTIKTAQAVISTLLRGGRGNMGTPTPMQPDATLVLYEHEACPYSRRVREVMTHLNLDYESRPSPHKGHVYRDELMALASTAQIPVLIDNNSADTVVKAQPIIDYLFKHYSKTGVTPKKYQTSGADNATWMNKASSLSSMMRGAQADHPKQNEARGKPEAPLHLYGFEASPFCRLVREKLSELEVGYVNHNVAREQIQDIGVFGMRFSVNLLRNPRQACKANAYQPIKGGKRERIQNEVMTDKLQFPYLVDPNTDSKLFESQAIIDYLEQNYG